MKNLPALLLLTSLLFTLSACKHDDEKDVGDIPDLNPTPPVDADPTPGPGACWDLGHSASDAGKSCGNDGDTTTIVEGGCTYTIQTQCKLKTAVNVQTQCNYNFCNCVDVQIAKDCPQDTEPDN